MERSSILLIIAAAVGCLWLAVAVSAAVVLATDVFLLTLLGVLFAVFLTNTSELLSSKLGFAYGLSLFAVVATLAVSAGTAVFLFGWQIEQQVKRASSHLDDASNRLRDWIQDHPIAETAISDLPFAGRLIADERTDSSNGKRPGESSSSHDERNQDPPSSDADADSAAASGSRSRANGNNGPAALASGGLSGSRIGQAAQIIAEIFRTTLGAVMNLAIVLFVGVFLAIDPQLYRDQIVRLFTPNSRSRVRQILNQMGATLWSWLLGRFASMLITGIGTSAALFLLGVPMPVLLGSLTGLLTFIPNVGPAIALAIAVLVALPTGGGVALSVVAVFLLFQLLESYVITPLIQQRQVSIPPAMLITWQVLLGMLAGFLGIMIATPLLAVALVLTRMAYLEDVLGDPGAEAS